MIFSSIKQQNKYLTLFDSRASQIKICTILCSFVLLFGCQSTKPNEDVQGKPARQTLEDLANKQIQINIESISMTKAQRASKLAALYQSILTLEPDQEVRAKVEYRLVQINTDAYEFIDEQSALSDSKQVSASQGINQQTLSETALNKLILSYQDLLKRYPNRSDNEHIQYQLAKALDLQGKLDKSLAQMERLLNDYPQTKYAAEIQFRRGDIYYNLQNYRMALSAYQAVLTAEEAQNTHDYRVNSMYMSGWALFKLNRLGDADIAFVRLLDYIVAQEKVLPYEDNFSFEKINARYVSLVADVQRVLSISLSQQKQSQTLVVLVNSFSSDGANEPTSALPHLYLFRHVLFKNLASFLIKNDLKYDAEKTYQAYLALSPNSIWAARYSLELMDLFKQQGKFAAIRDLKQWYVLQYGLQSQFWQQGITAKPSAMITARLLDEEILPNLLDFSYQNSRQRYAKAQKLPKGAARVSAFVDTANWLNTYITMAKLPQSAAIIKKLSTTKLKLSKGLLSDEFLFADASFEAHHFEQALISYQVIAYGEVLPLPEKKLAQAQSQTKSEKQYKTSNPATVLAAYEKSGEALTAGENDINKSLKAKPIESKAIQNLRLEAAYAATLTIRKMLEIAKVKQAAKTLTVQLTEQQQKLLLTRSVLDKAFVQNYHNDPRALTLATQQAQYAFTIADYAEVAYYSDYILQKHQADLATIEKRNTPIKLNKSAKKQVQIASQLQANSLYKQGVYLAAESSYALALRYVDQKSKVWQQMRNILASCIYFQAQALKVEQPLLAVKHYLRVGKTIPESSYRVTAEFDAANLLLAQQQWQQAVDVLILFQKHYPKHEYSASIPAKLAKSYENLERWELAAEQLLVMVNTQNSAAFSAELKREAQYTAATYYLKAGNRDKALDTFRAYAHRYPQPFDIAQEVRFKMSEFYRQSNEKNKQYFWYRKIISFHDKQAKSKASNINNRAMYLVSFSALGLGNAHQQTFKWIKLKVPLNKSLKRKQKSMKAAINYYQKVLNYQLAEFVPQATFNLAQMYSQLASDVMSSQRPGDLDELALEEYEILLEEIADPFVEKAIDIHVGNAERSWQDIFDKWVKQSFDALAELDPAQYNKQERASHAQQSIY